MVNATPNNPALLRRYLATFERRFSRHGDGIVYQRIEGQDGVRLPPAVAASLIAGMRATMTEADARQRWSGPGVIPALLFTPLVLIILGVILDLPATAAGLILPFTLAVVLLGPILGAVRMHLAWRQGLAEAERLLAAHEPVEAKALPLNPVRMVLWGAAALGTAVIVGLMIALLSAPAYAGVAIDRVLGALLLPIILVIVLLSVAASAIDAFQRRRLSEAEIADALVERRNRPL